MIFFKFGEYSLIAILIGNEEVQIDHVADPVPLLGIRDRNLFLRHQDYDQYKWTHPASRFQKRSDGF
jgi:hypothetical protein